MNDQHLAQFHDLPEGVDGSPARTLVTCTACGWTETTDPDPGLAGQAHKAHVDSLAAPPLSDADIARLARKVAELQADQAPQ